MSSPPPPPARCLVHGVCVCVCVLMERDDLGGPKLLYT